MQVEPIINLGHSSLTNTHPTLTGSDWVDTTKTLDGEKYAGMMEGIEEAKEKLEKRIDKEQEKKQLGD